MPLSSILRRSIFAASAGMLLPRSLRASEPLLSRHAIGSVASVEIPNNWSITNNLNEDMRLATRERLREVPEFSGNTNRLAFSAGRYENGRALAWAQVYLDRDENLLNVELRIADSSEIAELDRAMKRATTLAAPRAGFQLFDWQAARVIIDGDWGILRVSYGRTGVTGSAPVRVVRDLIFNGPDTVSVIAGYPESAAYLMQPIVSRVMASVRPNVRHRPLPPLRRW